MRRKLAKSLHKVLKCTKINVFKVLFSKNCPGVKPPGPHWEAPSPNPTPSALNSCLAGPDFFGRGMFCLTKFFVLGTALTLRLGYECSKLTSVRLQSTWVNTRKFVAYATCSRNLGYALRTSRDTNRKNWWIFFCTPPIRHHCLFDRAKTVIGPILALTLTWSCSLLTWCTITVFTIPTVNLNFIDTVDVTNIDHRSPFSCEYELWSESTSTSTWIRTSRACVWCVCVYVQCVACTLKRLSTSY